MIERTIENYFDGYLNAEADTLLKAFHPEARLYSNEDGVLDRTEMSDWLQNLRARKEKRDIRSAKVEILSVDRTDTTAIAKTKMTFEKFSFTDYLSLIQIGDQWIIVNKIYSMKKNED